MRVSADRKDPGCENFMRFVPGSISVTIDDKIVDTTKCISADEEKGVVIMYAVDKDGNFIVDENSIHTYALTGKVKISGDLWP